MTGDHQTQPDRVRPGQQPQTSSARVRSSKPAGRARCVPDRVVTAGKSRSLAGKSRPSCRYLPDDSSASPGGGRATCWRAHDQRDRAPWSLATAPDGSVVACRARVPAPSGGSRVRGRAPGAGHRGARETLTFIDGDVAVDPQWEPGHGQRLPPYARTELALRGAADLLRQLHAAASGFQPVITSYRFRPGLPGPRKSSPTATSARGIPSTATGYP